MRNEGCDEASALNTVYLIATGERPYLRGQRWDFEPLSHSGNPFDVCAVSSII